MTLPASVLLGLIRLYRAAVSPFLSVALGPDCRCRFTPVCSGYAAEAVRRHGAWRGSRLAARRVLKCTPFHPGGDDPVPATLRPARAGGRETLRASPFRG